MSELGDYKRMVSEPLERELRARLVASEARVAQLETALKVGRDALVGLAPALDRVGTAIIEGGPLDILAAELDHVIEGLEAALPQMAAALHKECEPLREGWTHER